MTDVLDQADIDALLNAVSTGEVEDQQQQGQIFSRFRRDLETVEIKEYDFKRPERISKDQMRALQTLHETFARNFGASLSGFLRTIVPMTTPRGELHALPLLWDLDDVNALWDRRLTAERYGRALVEAFDTLQRDGAKNARLLALHLHPWLIGQPYRVGHLDAALAEIMSRNACWPATAGQVIERYRSHPPGT
jgi:hypothetical protein